MNLFTSVATPIGALILRSDGISLTEVSATHHARTAAPGARRDDDLKLFSEARKQLADYFRGQLRVFELPLRLEGTEFQRRVWDELCLIPYGQTITYGELARRTGIPKACRAVGQANNKNPICIIVPCHRVIAAGGKPGGYAGGLQMKSALLRLEAKGAPAAKTG